MPEAPRLETFNDPDKAIKALIALLIEAYEKAKRVSREEAKQLLIQGLIRLLRKVSPRMDSVGCCIWDDETGLTVCLTPDECRQAGC